MARRGVAAAEPGLISYGPSEFIASRMLPTGKAVALSLIKVPKFVAESWRGFSSESMAGVITEEKGKQVLLVRDPATGGAARLEALNLSNDAAVVLQKNGKHILDVIGEVALRTNFQPKLDPLYQQVLRGRHEAEDLQQGRGTIEEMRRDPGLDSLHTLFQFYTPKASSSLSVDEAVRRGGLESVARAKAKQKKGAVLDTDSLKVRLFRMFEAAGSSGLQLKQIATQTQQPLSHVKAVVEEIAEQRKRVTDRKSVYFLKQQYNMQSALPEEPLAKKQKVGK
ncbi:hypothetical protein Esti_005629 [Eimeria stiedai]